MDLTPNGQESHGGLGTIRLLLVACGDSQPLPDIYATVEARLVALTLTECNEKSWAGNDITFW